MRVSGTAAARAALVAGVAAGLGLAGCGTGATRTTGPPPRVVVIGAAAAATAPGALARATLAVAPVPPGARPVRRLPVPLESGEAYALQHVTDAHRELLLRQGPAALGAYLARHLPVGAQLTGPDTASGTDMAPTTSWSITMPTTSAHVSFDELDYVTTVLPSGPTELRVDASVVWLPITRIALPTTGRVRITGYRLLSLAGNVAGPTSVVLTHAQAVRLAAAVAAAPSAASGDLCMEDFTLYTIEATDRAGGPWVWHASADVCPGVLLVTGFGHAATLDDRSCALDRVVGSLFPRGTAADTRGDLSTRDTCAHPDLRG